MNREITWRRLADRAVVLLLGVFLCVAGTLSRAGTTHASQKPHHSVHHKKSSRRGRVRGQKAIDGDRAREIQEALIREHYLKGQPTGLWDAGTQTAMRKYQADQGWQNKTVPDSRALIRLGLGPDTGRLLNPESAMTTAPTSPHAHGSAPGTTSSQASSAAIPAGNSMPAGSAPVSTGSSAISADPVR